MCPELAINGGPQLRQTPFPSWPVHGEAEEKALLDVLHSGHWGRLNGGRVSAFETAFARAHGCEHAVAVTNGTTALLLALLAVGIEEGDEVIVPPYTFLATATCAMLANAVPVFADIHPDTYCLDPEKIEAAITPRTKAIIPVHFAGQMADMERIGEMARRHDLAVIEDAAHAHGATHEKGPAGSLGDMACFSFQSSKNMSAGEGGIVTTNDADLYRTAFSIHHCGREEGGAWYEHRIVAMNLRMTEYQAALLHCGLGRLEEQTRIRDTNGRYLNGRLSPIPGLSPLPRGRGETRHSYHLYVIRYDAAAFDGVPRARFLAAMQAEGIPIGEGYGLPLYKQHIFTGKVFGPYTGYKRTHPDLDFRGVDCPVCERACAEVCWIPQQALLGTREDMDDIVRAAEKVYAHREELRE